jgi:hypothetical protein
MANDTYDLGDTPAPVPTAPQPGYDLGDTPVPPSPPSPPDPRSFANRLGRAVTDYATWMPDLVTSAHRGANWLADKAFEAVMPGATPGHGVRDWEKAKGAEVPYLAPMLRSATGIPELPADAGWGERLAEAGLTAGVGAGINAAGRGVRAGYQALTGPANPLADIPKVQSELGAARDMDYALARAADVRLKPEVGPQVAAAMEHGYPPGMPGAPNVPTGLRPQGVIPETAPGTYANVRNLETMDPQVWTPYAGNPTATASRGYLTPSDLETVRTGLNDVRAGAGRGAERRGANLAIGMLDQFTENIPQSALHPTSVDPPGLASAAYQSARRNHAALERLNFLTQTEAGIEAKAAAKAGGGGGAEQSMRNVVANALAKNEAGGGPLYGFSPQEIEAARAVSEGSGPMERAARRIGSGAPDTMMKIAAHSQLPFYAGAVSHYFGGNPAVGFGLGMIPGGVAYGAKKYADYATRQAYQRMQEIVAARSPWAASQGIVAPTLPHAMTRADVAQAMARGALRGGVPQLEDQNAP